MNEITGQAVVDKLNAMVKKDPLAFTHLVDLRVDCGALHIARPELPVCISFYGRPLIGLLEVLNMFFEHIVVVKADGKVRCFKYCPPEGEK